MPFRFRQKGIIHLGILGLIVLAGGLFAASKLASNPDLTFFNLAEQAKGIEKTICETNRGKTLTRCKEKAKKANSQTPKQEVTPCAILPKCGRYEVINNCKCSSIAGHVPPCVTKECSDNPVSGGSLCNPSPDKPNETKYCCQEAGKLIANRCK